MIVDVDVSHICCFVPTWFVWHIVGYVLAVDSKVFKTYVLHHSQNMVRVAWFCFMLFLILLHLLAQLLQIELSMCLDTVESLSVYTYNGRLCYEGIRVYLIN